jgi:hypothetical protein
MNIGFLVSWGLNFVFISIVLAAIDEYGHYRLEKMPFVLFALAVILPTALEIAAYISTGRPFLLMVLPEEWWGWLLG